METVGIVNTLWIAATKIPLANFCNPTKLNEKEFIINLFTLSNDTKPCLKYNLQKDEFTIWKDMIFNPENINHQQVSFNLVINDTIYFQLTNGFLLTYSIKYNHKQKSKWNLYRSSLCSYIGFGSCYAKVNNSIHIIGGGSSNKHAVWILNDTDKSPQYKILHRFNEMDDNEGLTNAGLCYIHSQERLILFGGYNCTEWESQRDILIYDLKRDNSWKRSNVRLPIAMDSFGYVLSMDEKYIIIFGGSDKHNKCMDVIYILDIELMKIRKLNELYCPRKGNFHACIGHDTINNELLVRGFIKDCWKLNIFKNVRRLSDVVIRLIQSYHFDEVIHLFDKKDGAHWKIKLDKIISAK